MAMGMAPTAGKCVAASITRVPAGVMGRPSPAGSCWDQAVPQKHKQIIRKPKVMAREFIGVLFRSRKLIPLSLQRRSNLHSTEFRKKLFLGRYNTRMGDAPTRLATYLT
jgi:hypothetical protein